MIQELKLREPTFIDDFVSLSDFVRAFFGWWYGDMPIYLFSLMVRIITIINDRTSFSLVLKGFFAPWKRDFDILGTLVGIIIKTIYLPIVGSMFVIIVSLFLVIFIIQLALLPVILGLIIINPFLAP